MLKPVQVLSSRLAGEPLPRFLTIAAGDIVSFAPFCRLFSSTHLQSTGTTLSACFTAFHETKVECLNSSSVFPACIIAAWNRVHPLTTVQSECGLNLHRTDNPKKAVEVKVYPQRVDEEFPVKLSDGNAKLAAIEEELALQMGHICIYLPAGWWTYELCYLRHLRQIHVGSAGSPEQVHMLGESPISGHGE